MKRYELAIISGRRILNTIWFNAVSEIENIKDLRLCQYQITDYNTLDKIEEGILDLETFGNSIINR